jgi:hypothetical protein
VRSAPHRRAVDNRTGRGPDRGSWLTWAAFLLGVAVVSGAAGYALNRATTGNHPTPSATSSMSTAGATGAGARGLPGLTAEQVAIRLAAAGLPLHTTVVYAQTGDPDNLLGRPGGYTSKIAFVDRRIAAGPVATTRADAIERGGSIEVYPNVAGAQARTDYLRTVSSASPIFAEFTYLRGGIVLRVSRYLAPDAAAGYEAALGRLTT